MPSCRSVHCGRYRRRPRTESSKRWSMIIDHLTPMAPLAPGTYSIKNVRFRNVAVLPDDNRDSDIVGRPEENSVRGKWDVSRLGNGRYTIQNQAIDHFAGSAHGAGEGDSVYGGERAKQLTITEMKFRGRYTISPLDADLFWGLPDGDADTPITLAIVATDAKNQWMFTPVVDMRRRLPNSVHTQSQGQVATAYETSSMSSLTPHMLQMSLSSDASQHGFIGTDSSALRPPRPASDAHVYVRNLILKGNGCPLYIPEPSGNSPVYRTKGVRIGDVGFVTDDGYFKALFNLRASVYDPINSRRVPDGFEQIDLHGDDIEVVPNYFKSGRIVASVTNTSGVLGPDTPPVAGLSAVSNDHRLIWNTSEGAVLHLPHGATRLRCDSGRFREQAIRNGYNWYKYAWETRGCDVRNGALCLVTGTDKTDTWMVGSFSQTPPGSQVLLNIGTDVAIHENFPCSYSWIGTNPAMRLSECRPSMIDMTIDAADMERDDAVFRSDTPGGLTHCVFVRGFRISLRKSLWAYLSRSPLPAELSLIQDSAPEDFSGGQDRGHPPGSFSSVFTWGRGGDNSGGEGQPRMFSSESSPQQPGLPNEEAIVEYMPTAVPVDPAAMVNDLLLNLVPEAQVAVVHDDEWHSLMREDDADFPDSSELAARLNRRFMMDVRTSEGSVSLRPAEASSKRSSGKSSFPLSSYLLPSDQGSSRNVGDNLDLDPHAKPVLLGDEGRKMSTSMSRPFYPPFMKNTVGPTVTDHAEDGASNIQIEPSTRPKHLPSSHANLKKHLISQFGLKPYLCRTCRNGFATRRARKRHMTMECPNPLSRTSRFGPESSSEDEDSIASNPSNPKDENVTASTLGGEAIRPKISDVDVVNVVNQMLSEDDGKVSASTVDFLVELVKCDTPCLWIFQSDVFETLSSRLEHCLRYAPQGTIDLMLQLGRRGNRIGGEMEYGILEIIFATFAGADHDVAMSMIDILAQSAMDDNLRRIMLDSNVLPILAHMLEDRDSGTYESAANALLELLKHDDSRRTVLDSNAVAIFITKLQDSDLDVQNSAAHALAELAKHDDSRRTMLDSNAVAVLITKLQHGDSDVRTSAAQALVELAEHDDSRRTILDLNAVATLIAKLQDGRSHVCQPADQALVELAKIDGLRRTMFNADIVAILITKLQDGYSHVRQAATKALVELARHDDLRTILDSNAIANLIARSQGSDPHGWNSVARVLTELAKIDGLRRTMLNSNIVAILITKLEDGHSRVHQPTARVLVELARHDESRRAMLDSNAVSILISNLQDSDWCARQSAAEVLVKLGKHDDSRRVILNLNGVAILIIKLQDSDPDVRDSAAQALVELAKHDDSRVMLDLNAAAILVAYFQDSGPHVWNSAPQALVELAKHDGLRRTMLNSNIVAILITKLQDRHSHVRQAAARALTELAKHDDSRRAMLELNTVAILITELRDSCSDVRNSVAHALLELGKHDDSRRTILDLNAVAILVTRLQDRDSFVRQLVAEVLVELGKHDDSRRVMLVSNAVATLITKLQDNDSDVRQSVAEALMELGRHNDSRTVLVWNAVVILITKLQDSHSDVRNSAAQTLVELSKHDDLRRTVFNSNVVAVITTKLQGSHSRVLQPAVQVFMELAKHDDSRRTMLDLNGVAILITKLQDSDSNLQNSVTQALVELAKHDDSCPNVLYINVLATLLRALRDSRLHGHEAITHMLAGLITQKDPHQRMSLSRLVVMLVMALAGRPDRLKETFNSVIESTKRGLFSDVP